MNPPFVRCRYCVAFEPCNLGNVYGRCRRKSPVPPKDAGSETVWPIVSVTTVGYGKLIQEALKDMLAEAGVDDGGLKPKELMGLLSKEAAADLRAGPR